MGAFQDGYAYLAKSMGAIGASVQGGGYVQTIEEEIDKLWQGLNEELGGSHMGIDKAKGFAAEHWHAGTFNINAAIRGSSNRVEVAKGVRNQLGSPDIVGAAGDAGLKYYKTAADSAKEQAKSLYERYKQYESQTKSNGGTPKSFEEYSQKAPGLAASDPLYGGQVRIIPADQLKKAEEWLKEQIAKEQGRRPDQVKRYQDTLNLIRDRLRDSEGNESIPLTAKDAEKIAKDVQGGIFDPKKFGLSTEQLLKDQYRYIGAQAVQAGFSAAAISIALKTAPELMKGIRHLIETGEIDAEHAKKTGMVVLSSGAEGFLRGMLSSALTIACKAGLCGEALKAVSPPLVGGLVVFALDAAKGAFGVVVGNKDGREFGKEIAKEAFSATGAMAVGSALNVVVPGLGFMIGSLIGSMMGSFTYQVVTKTTQADKMVSFFKHKVELLQRYAAELLKIDLDQFKSLTNRYNSAADRICSATDEHQLNIALKTCMSDLRIDLPWEGDFDNFMRDKNKHLVFE